MSVTLAELSRLAIDTGQPLGDLCRRHAMEELLRRVAATEAGSQMVLRGSLLTRLWARPAYRPALDVDFVTTYPFDPDRVTLALARACASKPVMAGERDLVVFLLETIVPTTTWAETPFPGSRFRIAAEVGGERLEFQVDVGYDDPLVPPPVWIDMPPLLPGPPARVLACRPELGCAWKVHGLFEFPHWRAKDLHDVALIARHNALDPGLFTEAIRVAFTSRQTPLTAALRLFRGEFGGSPRSRRRWRAFRLERADPRIPADHREVVRFVAETLRPVFDNLARDGCTDTHVCGIEKNASPG